MRIKAGIIKHKVFGAVGVLGLLLSFSAAANPEGGVVAAGSATITNADKLTTIKQATDKAVIDWRSFNIAPDEHTEFKQPSASSITLNRINDTNPSAINGRLTANGHVMLVNPNGILFGKNSVIDVAAITASTADIHNKNFMQGNMIFNKAGKENALIQNDGLITAKEAGLANFVAPRFLNSGIITAKLGKIQVGSGETFTLDMAGDGLLKVAINKDTRLGQQIINQGLMSANGGQVRLTAAAAREVVDSVISNSGIIEATSLSEKNGVIRLEGKNSTVINSGVINASGRKEKQRGGDITITGKNVALMDGTLIDASGHTGKSNTTNDKTITQKREGAAGGDIKIGGDYLGKGETPTAENLYVSPNSYIFNDALETGDAGRTIFWSDNVTSFYGNVFARANVGDGGFVETSGHKFLDAQGFVDLTTNSGERGTYFLDPTDIAIYGSFVPTDVSGLWAWFDATKITGRTDGQTISTWVDSSGLGNSAAAFGTGPTYKTNIVNGNPVARFISNNGLYTPSVTLGDWAVFAAFNNTAGVDSYERLVDKDYINGFWLGRNSNNPNSFGGGVKESISPFGKYVTATDGQWNTIAHQRSGTTHTISANGSASVASGVVNGTATSASAIGIGAWYDNSGGSGTQSAVNIDIGEVLIYNTALSTNNKNLIDQYQSAKWGIALNPNSGTALTEVVEATASTGYSVFTTRYLERLSTSANISLQATNNITLDLKGDTLALASGRDLTLTAGNDIISASNGTITTAGVGNIYLNATRDVVFNNAVNFNALGSGEVRFRADRQIGFFSGGGITTQGSAVTLNSDRDATNGGGIFLNNGGNITTNGGAITLGGGSNPLTGFAQGINVSFYGSNVSNGIRVSGANLNSGNGTITANGEGFNTSEGILFHGPTINSGTGTQLWRSNSTDITLNGGHGALTSTNAGTAITLASGRNFVENASAPTLSTASGRWLIYSTNPASNSLTTLTSSFRRFTCTYSGACPALGSGNGLLYSYTPQLTATPNAIAAITTGAAVPTLTSYAYTLSNYLGSDAASDVVTGSLDGSTTYSQGSPAGDYNINYASGALTSALGYGFTYANNPTAIRVNALVGDPGRAGGNPPPPVIEEEPPVVVIPPVVEVPPVVITPPTTPRPELTLDIQRIVDAPRRYAESSSFFNPNLRHRASSGPFGKLDVPFPFEYDTREVLFFHPDLQKRFGLPNRQEEEEEESLRWAPRFYFGY